MEKLSPANDTNINMQQEEQVKRYDESSDNFPTNEMSRDEKMKARIDRLQKLRKRSDDALQANRKEVYEEFQRKKTNPKELIRQERKREAEKLLARQDAQERGEDYERNRFWDYSVESVEKWEKKQGKKAKRANIGFTDFNQAAHKKYKKQLNEFKPDLAVYNEQKMKSTTLATTEDGEIIHIDAESSFYRDANSLQYASIDNVPSPQAVDRLVTNVNKQIAQRKKFSRRKTIEDDEITYINERNRRFNEKIGRHYDKYTREIRENLERGTAL